MKIAVTKIGNKHWTGGTTYLKNFSGIIKSQLCNKLSLNLISNLEDDNKDIKNNFDCIINLPKKKWSKFLQIFSFEINKIVNQYSIDVLIETTEFFGFFCKKKIVTWLPDFQHKYYPKYFHFYDYYKRELSFLIKISLRNRILVSSNNAKEDCVKFYKVDPKKIFVAPFSINLDPTKYLNKKDYLKKKYNITQNYFYIPNQFWQHKNHILIFNFLDKIFDNQKIYKKLPEFIFTGLPLDKRNKKFSNFILEKMNSKKYNDKVKYLGIIPIEDVYTLNANCIALINPSFFEGWSTTVEEAKSLGTKMILSNIKLHLEQAKNAFFFDPKKVESFQNVILNFIETEKEINDYRDISKIKQYTELRKTEYAKAIYRAFHFKN